jgi:hypothetical protein
MTLPSSRHRTTQSLMLLLMLNILPSSEPHLTTPPPLKFTWSKSHRFHKQLWPTPRPGGQTQQRRDLTQVSIYRQPRSSLTCIRLQSSQGEGISAGTSIILQLVYQTPRLIFYTVKAWLSARSIRIQSGILWLPSKKHMLLS